MIAAATLFLIALTSGGTRVPWLSPTILVLVAASLALGAALVWWLRQAPEPFLPLNVLKNPVMRMGTAATSCALGAVLGLTVYLPLYFQVVHKLSAVDAGLALIPIVVMTVPGSMLSGTLDDASAPLQGVGDRRRDHRDRGGRRAWCAGRRCRSTASSSR